MDAKLVRILFGLCLVTGLVQQRAQAHSDGEPNTICIYHDTKYTCDCEYSNQPIELPILDGNVFHISIANCKNIVIVSNFLLNTFGLRSISFTNVENLVLQQSSLTFPQLLSSTRLIVEFNNVSIRSMDSHTFTGNIDEITFTSSKIDLIRPFAFTAFRDKAYLVKFVNTQFGVVEPQAFKKFSVDQLEIANCVFQTILPSRAFYDVEVKDFFKVYGSKFNGAFSRAFSFSAVSMLTFTDNYFNKFEGECFEIKIAENVLIRNNTFTNIHPAIFRELTVTADSLKRSEKIEFRLFDNKVQQTNGPVPLYLSKQFQVAIRKLYFTVEVDCEQVSQLAKYEFFSSNEDFIYLLPRGNEKFVTFQQMLNVNCKYRSDWLYIGIGLGGLLLLAIIVAVLAVYFVRKKQNKNKLDIIMPEAKTYRETQIVLQIENAGLLKTDL